MKRGTGQRRLEIALDGAHREGILVAGFVIGHGSTVDVHAERVGLRTEAGSADLGRAGVVGDVRAEVAVGEAEADALEKRADALGKLDNVGQLELVLSKLPDIVKAASAPLADANITLVGDSVNPIAKGAGSGLVSTMELIQGATGIDVAGMIAKLGEQTDEPQA